MKLRVGVAMQGAGNALQRTNSRRSSKSEWVEFRKELRREHGHFWRGLERLNLGGKKMFLLLLGSIPKPGCRCRCC